MVEFELMLDIMVFHASANKNYEDPIKSVDNTKYHFQTFKGSYLCNHSCDLVEFRNHPRSYTFPRYINNEDPIKKEGTGVLATLNIIFSECQGQLTQQSAVGSGRISN